MDLARFPPLVTLLSFKLLSVQKKKLHLASKFLTQSHHSAVSRCPFVEMLHIVIYHLTPQIGYGVGMNGL